MGLEIVVRQSAHTGVRWKAIVVESHAVTHWQYGSGEKCKLLFKLTRPMIEKLKIANAQHT